MSKAMIDDARNFRARIGKILHIVFGGRNAEKRLSRAAGTTPRTARNWLDGQNAPSSSALISLMRESEEILREILILAGRGDVADMLAARAALDDLEAALSRLRSREE